MNNDFLNILSNQPPPGFSTQKLLAYLRGELPPEEARVIEEILADGGMDAEAIEGLQMLPPQELSGYKHQLDNFIHQHLKAERPARRKPLQPSMNMLLLAIALILSLAVLVWYIYQHLHLSANP